MSLVQNESHLFVLLERVEWVRSIEAVALCADVPVRYRFEAAVPVTDVASCSF
jgi:hypothetical protein